MNIKYKEFHISEIIYTYILSNFFCSTKSLDSYRSNEILWVYSEFGHNPMETPQCAARG